MNTQLTSIISGCLRPTIQTLARRKTIKSARLRLEPLEARLLLSVDGFRPPQLENVIVGLDMGARPEDVAHHVTSSLGGHVGHLYQHAFKGFSASMPAAAIDALTGNPRVQYVVPDTQFEIAAQELPDGIDRIDAELNPTGIAGTADVDVDIAIIDSGIDLDHPDLFVQPGVNFVSKGGDTYDDGNGHGTHVAGTAAALDNDFGVVGVAPGARLWPVRVMHNNGRGDLSDILAGMDWVTANSDTIEVANMSVTALYAPPMVEAVQSMVSAGVVLVAASGNWGDWIADEPARQPGALAVSAIIDTDGRPGGLGPATEHGADDTFAVFSSYDDKIELAAPGVEVLSTWKGGGYSYSSGTSMAAPHVSGTAGLFMSEYDGYFNQVGGDRDELDVALVRQALIYSGQPQDTWGPADTFDRGTHKEPLVDASGNWVTQPVASVPSALNPWQDFGGVPDVSDNVVIRIDARDVDTLAGQLTVWAEIDGQALPAIYQPASASYEVVWDTTTTPDGEVSIVAYAYDGVNTSDSAAALTVNNLAVQVDNANIQLPTVSIIATDADAAEANQDPGRFTISRSDNSGDLLVHYSITGSAVNGTDYEMLFENITIPAGSSSAIIDVIPIDDPDVEPTEFVTLTLAADPAYTLGSADNATVSIVDNDAETLTYVKTHEPPLAIPDQGAVSSTLVVADAYVIDDLAVEIDINHSRPGDLTVELTHAGITINLSPSGGSGEDFIGQDVVGIWELTVTDDKKKKVGTLQSWSLIVTPEPVSAAASVPDGAMFVGFVAARHSLVVNEVQQGAASRRLTISSVATPLEVDAVRSESSELVSTIIPQHTRTELAASRGFRETAAVDRVFAGVEQQGFEDLFFPSLSL